MYVINNKLIELWVN